MRRCSPVSGRDKPVTMPCTHQATADRQTGRQTETDRQTDDWHPHCQCGMLCLKQCGWYTIEY